jgi:hypothetical protein
VLEIAMTQQTVIRWPTSLLPCFPILLGLAILSPALAQDMPFPQADRQLVNDSQLRGTSSESELRRWLENMWIHHRFTFAEMTQVTGKSEPELRQLIEHFSLEHNLAARTDQGKLLVLPYPGGRHPRIGFLEGAIDPQRETKLSVFAPWDQRAYAVIDSPEAIWSNLGLTYLAHTHIPTIWSEQNIELPQQEWQQLPDGNFESVRVLPNGIEFGVKVIPLVGQLRMKMWLTNGSDRELSDLRVQNCIMLKGLPGFETQTNDNKLFDSGYALAFSANRQRWVITAWDPVHRNWGNANCPCIHSDPKFDDCPVGETKFLRGWFSFYEGTDIVAELARIEATGWRTHPLHHRGIPVK